MEPLYYKIPILDVVLYHDIYYINMHCRSLLHYTHIYIIYLHAYKHWKLNQFITADLNIWHGLEYDFGMHPLLALGS